MKKPQVVFFIESPEGKYLTDPDKGSDPLTVNPFKAWQFEDGYCWPMLDDNGDCALQTLKFLQSEVPEKYENYRISEHEFADYRAPYPIKGHPRCVHVI